MTTFSRGGWNSPERHNRRPLLCREESCLCSRGSGLSWGIQPLWGGGRLSAFFLGSPSAHSHISSCATSRVWSAQLYASSIPPTAQLDGRLREATACRSAHFFVPCRPHCSASQSRSLSRICWLRMNEWSRMDEWLQTAQARARGEILSLGGTVQCWGTAGLPSPPPCAGIWVVRRTPLWPHLPAPSEHELHLYLHCAPFLHFLPPHLISLTLLEQRPFILLLSQGLSPVAQRRHWASC